MTLLDKWENAEFCVAMNNRGVASEINANTTVLFIF